MNGSDHLDLLGFKVYGKPPTPKQWTGGSDAAILKDAAETISRLEADHASKDQTIATLTERVRVLEEVMDKLPKCWRLDENGELVQDHPIVPGGTYYERRNGHIGEMQGLVMSPPDDDGYASAHWRTGAGSMIRVDRIYDTREAALAEKGGEDA